MTEHIDRTEHTYTTFKLPEVNSILYITPDYQIHSQRKYPSLWHRFWYRLLLDWRWERKDAKQT